MTEMELWVGPKGAVGIKTDSGMGSPGWNHWAVLLHRPSGKVLRIELPDMKSRESCDGKWKFATRFKNLGVTGRTNV